MNSYIWIIGGGIMQEPVVQAAKARGYQIFLTDRDPACHCARLANVFQRLDTYDVTGHLEFAKRTNHKIAGVIVDAIDVARTGAVVAEYLKLPTMGGKAAKLAGNKADFHTLVVRHDAPYFVIGEPDEHITEIYIKWLKLMRFEDLHVLPCVVKPSDNCASRGVSLVTDLDEFAIAVEYARKHSKNDTRIIVEQYCPGTEFSTDWFIYPNTEKVIMVNGSKREFSESNFGVEQLYTNCHTLPNELSERAIEVAKLIGHQGGPLKLDWTYSKEFGWLLMEAACRWSGGFDHNFAQVLSCGRDLTGLLIDWCTGNPIDDSLLEIPKARKWSCGYAPAYNPGKINGWSGLEEARKMIDPGWIFVRSNSSILELKNCADRPVFIIAGGDSEEEAIKNAKLCSGIISPRYTNDKIN